MHQDDSDAVLNIVDAFLAQSNFDTGIDNSAENIFSIIREPHIQETGQPEASVLYCEEKELSGPSEAYDSVEKLSEVVGEEIIIEVINVPAPSSGIEDVLKSHEEDNGSSEETNEHEEENDQGRPNDILNLRKRSKKHDVDISSWKRNMNKVKREKGLDYTGKRKYNGKWSYDIPKSKKILTNPCTCKIKNSSQKIQCNKVTQENREMIFSMFWNHMTWSERKVYNQGLVKIEAVQRRRGAEETSKRIFSLKYHLKVNNTKILVGMNVGNEGVYGSQLGKIGQIAGSGKKIQRQKRRSEKKQLSEQEPEVTVKA
nr:unnamed protein product [Callosobruchus analis]